MGELSGRPGFDRLLNEIENLSLREVRMGFGDIYVAATHQAYSKYMVDCDGTGKLLFDVDGAVEDLKRSAVLIKCGAINPKPGTRDHAVIKVLETMLEKYGRFSKERIEEIKSQAR